MTARMSNVWRASLTPERKLSLFNRTPGPPKASWRALVHIQAQRLTDECGLVPEGNQSHPTFGQIKAAITHAQKTADQRGSIRDWWTGAAIETAWSDLQAARESLVRVQDEAVLRAELPYLQRLLANRPADDPQRAAIANCIVHLEQTIDREMLFHLRQEANVTIDRDHTAVRRFRNLLVMVTAVLSIFVVIFGIFDYTDRLILSIGGLGGALTMIAPLRERQRLSGPYSLEILQALLKVPAGAATALLAVILLRGGLASGVLEPVTGMRAAFYAVVFGISQQLFTGLVDQQASALIGTAGPRTDPAKMTSPTGPPALGVKQTGQP